MSENLKPKKSQMERSSSSEVAEVEQSGGDRSNSCKSLGAFLKCSHGTIDLPAKFCIQGASNIESSGKKKVTLENFELLKYLGEGMFGKVLLCKEKATGQHYAIKVLRKEFIIEKRAVAHTLLEGKVLRSTNHPFLTSLKYSFQTAEHLFHVMEYLPGGHLNFHLFHVRKFSEDRVRFYAAEIISALGYLHSLGIIYRDLKPENLLLDKDGHIKIADFGLCKEEMSYGQKTKTICGTKEYMAPEVIPGNEYGRAVDWWGVGVLMFKMLSGKLPFNKTNLKNLLRVFLTKKLYFPAEITIEAKAILTGLLKKDPKKRLGGGPNDAKDIMDHIFFSSIDWAELVQKKIHPPFKPIIKSDTDTSNFAPNNTDEKVELASLNQDAILNSGNRFYLSEEEDDFPGFSYTRSHSAADSFNPFPRIC